MNNSTVSNYEHQCSDVVNTLFIVLMSVISIAAFIGNLLVTVVFLKTLSLRTSTNYYIVNMAISDLLCSCFNWPLYATEGMLTRRELITGPLATAFCKLGMYCRGVSQVVSVLSLVLIAVDRYFAIVFPLKSTRWNGKRVRVSLLLMSWFIPILCGIPYFVFTDVVEVDGYTFCRTLWNKFVNASFNVAGFIVFYCTPVILMIILYSRIVKTLRKGRTMLGLMNEKRQKQSQKITKMLIIMVVVFFVCWTPLCVYLTLKLLKPDMFLRDHCHTMVSLFFYLFPSLSTAINPVILFLFSSNYREALNSLALRIFCFFQCRPLYINPARCASTHITHIQDDKKEDDAKASCKANRDGTAFVLQNLRRSHGRVSDYYSQP